MNAEESIAAAKRVREALLRAEALENPGLVVQAADLRAVIDAISQYIEPVTPEALGKANDEIDAALAEANVDLDGVPMLAARAYREFESESMEHMAILSGAHAMLLRAGFIAGYGIGWYERTEVRP